MNFLFEIVQVLFKTAQFFFLAVKTALKFPGVTAATTSLVMTVTTATISSMTAVTVPTASCVMAVITATMSSVMTLTGATMSRVMAVTVRAQLFQPLWSGSLPLALTHIVYLLSSKVN